MSKIPKRQPTCDESRYRKLKEQFPELEFKDFISGIRFEEMPEDMEEAYGQILKEEETRAFIIGKAGYLL